MDYSEVESKRFGLKVFKGFVEDISTKELLNEIHEKNVELAIIRVPVEKQFHIT